MAKKKTPVTVTIKEHKPRKPNDNQVWAVRIEDGKSDLVIPQRFSRQHSAKKGALRKLDARTTNGYPGREWNYMGGYVWHTTDGREILFVVRPLTKKKP